MSQDAKLWPHQPTDVQRILAVLNMICAKMDTYHLRSSATLAQILSKESKNMASLADIEAAVAAETTVEQSVVVLLGQLSADLQTALANNDPAAMQAVVDSLNTNAATLSAAVAANTSQQPAPAPEPAPAP